MGRYTSNRGKNQLPDHRSHYSRLASFKLLLREDSARKAKPGCGITIPSDITEHYYLFPFFHGGFASCLIRSPDTPWIPRGRINGPLWFGPLSLSYLVYQTNYLVSVPSPVRQQCLLCFFFPSPRRLSWLLVLHHLPQAAGLSGIYIYLCFFLLLHWSALLSYVLSSSYLHCLLPLICLVFLWCVFLSCNLSVNALLLFTRLPLFLSHRFTPSLNSYFPRMSLRLVQLYLAEVLVWYIHL